MTLTVKDLREAIKDLDDEEPVYIEKACNLKGVRGAFDTQIVHDKYPLSEEHLKIYTVHEHEGRKFVYTDAEYLTGFNARFVRLMNDDGTLKDEKVFAIEANY